MVNCGMRRERKEEGRGEGGTSSVRSCQRTVSIPSRFLCNMLYTYTEHLGFPELRNDPPKKNTDITRITPVLCEAETGVMPKEKRQNGSGGMCFKNANDAGYSQQETGQ